MKAKRATKKSNLRAKDKSNRTVQAKAKSSQIANPWVKIKLKAKYVLLILLVAGLAIKLYPSATSDFVVNFDSIYHARIGQIVADTGWVPSVDPAAGGRPQLYPPFYHLLLGYASKISGVAVIDLVKFILPTVSALLVLPVFFLARKYRNEKTALFAALLTMLNPVIFAQSYDSPQLFGFLLFPLIAYFFFRGQYYFCGPMLAVTLLFNYVAAASIAAVLIAYAVFKKIRRGGNNPLIYAGLTLAIGFGLASPWLLVAASRAGQCLDVSTAVSTLTNVGINNLLAFMPFVAFFLVWPLCSLRGKGDDYVLFWKAAVFLGGVGFLASILIPQLHPYDQLLLIGFGLVFLIPEIKMRKTATVVLIALLVISLALVSLQIRPALSSDDLAAARWAAANAKNGSVLANPELSGTINLFAEAKMAETGGVRTEFDLFLECIPDSTRWTNMFDALASADVQTTQKTLDSYGVGYVVLGARDVWDYRFDVQKFENLTGWKVVFRSGDTKVYARA